MIDRHELLATLKPLVTQLEESIRERALATPEVAAHLEQEHHKAVVAERTAMSLEEWRDGEITQAAVAWVLGCVFVRFLEDNGLIDEALISGPGGRRAAALGHREEHFRVHPEHSDREYLEQSFKVVAAFPAVAPLYDQRHNPLWRLAPTADGARLLREAFTALDPDTGRLIHDFSDPQLGTRFLGDLYQDLSETAKKRYALLQTPHFIERFILERTLTPAIAEFGLDTVRLIDPTCGSGHFLIGAFERLFTLWQDREPGTPATALAQRALDATFGVDLNPYASAIARFRLVIVAMHACGVHRLSEAPAFHVNIATGDSLLHGAEPGQFAGMAHYREGIRHVFETEDAGELARLLGQGYHVVVGNPPYITGDDQALRDAYRDRYTSCTGHFSLGVPFMERFFELASPEAPGERGVLSGFVGKITGNNFMRREFGARLVEDFLPSQDIQLVIDTSRAHIPGHGTPTVMIFGRSRSAVSKTLRVVDGIRSEARRPADPTNGAVWLSIVKLVDTPGSQDAYVRASDVDREELFKHPLILGIGRDLKRRLEKAGSERLAEVVVDSGRTTHTGEDDAFFLPRHVERTRGLSGHVVELVTGDAVRDWGIAPDSIALFPYSPRTASALESLGPELLHLMWPRRALLAARKDYGQTPAQRGLHWYEHSMFFPERFRCAQVISWAEVATHNHFALERGRRVFKQTAPVIILGADAVDDDYFGLLSILNSSCACFWLKQTCHGKGGGGIGGGIAEEAWEQFYAMNPRAVKQLPLPPRLASAHARTLDLLAGRRDLTITDDEVQGPVFRVLDEWAEREKAITARMVGIQEEMDWYVMASFGLVSSDLALNGDEEPPPLKLGQRAFEIVLAREVANGVTETTWFERHGSTPITEPPRDWPEAYRTVVERRIDLIESDPDVGLIERPEHKRRWARKSWHDRRREALTVLALDALEDRALWSEPRLRSTAELADHLRRDPRLVEALELLGGGDSDLGSTVRGLVLEAAVPHLAALRLTEKGLRKRAVWEKVWHLQREDDRREARLGARDGDGRQATLPGADGEGAESPERIPAPPRYGKEDFRSSVSWSLRGKLDVPKERFHLIPNAERGADRSPVVAWAGWDERDLARALAGRIMELREQEATEAERLAPLLAGVLEQVPWIHQWYPDTDPLYGGPPGQYFENWLDGQLAELGITRDNLRAWRPPTPTRGRKAKAGAA